MVLLCVFVADVVVDVCCCCLYVLLLLFMCTCLLFVFVGGVAYGRDCVC